MFTDRARAWSQGFVEPVARGFGRLGFSPDTLTVVGLLLHVPVAWALYQGKLGTAAVLLALAAAFDALDGSLARATGRTTRAGAFLDSNLDRIAEIVVFAGLVTYAARAGQPRDVFLAYSALTGSLMVSYARARSEALGLDTKAGIFGRFERMLVLVVGLALGWLTATLAILTVGAWLTAAMRIADAHARGRRTPA